MTNHDTPQAYIKFLEVELRKLKERSNIQENMIHDLRTTCQDLKYQLIEKHGELNGHSSKDD
jgi:hypothetical protein